MAYAIRVKQDELVASKEALSMDSKSRYFLQGLPATANWTQAQEVIKQLGWVADTQEDRRWIRGRPTWTIVSQHPPPCSEAQIVLGYERCWLTIRPARKPMPLSEKIPECESDMGPSTWTQATRGYSGKARQALGTSGKGRGDAKSDPIPRTPCDPATGDDTHASKRPRHQATSSTAPPAPAKLYAGPSESLHQQVQSLESAMRRMEEMFRQFTQQSDPQRAPPPEAHSHLRGGGNREPEGTERPDRERSPRRDEQMTS